jgi:hypothetical protein
MLTKIEALYYRSLRYISQTLEPFQVLIGPNASGKSTFLDVIAFVADIINEPTPVDAIRQRAADIRDLIWMREGDWLELAVEARIPQSVKESVRASHPKLRYEVRVGIQDERTGLALLTETLWLVPPGTDTNGKYRQSEMFPHAPTPPDQITYAAKHTPANWRKIVNKTEAGNDYFQSETGKWNNMFRLGPRRSALANLPED